MEIMQLCFLVYVISGYFFNQIVNFCIPSHLVTRKPTSGTTVDVKSKHGPGILIYTGPKGPPVDLPFDSEGRYVYPAYLIRGGQNSQSGSSFWAFVVFSLPKNYVNDVFIASDEVHHPCVKINSQFYIYVVIQSQKNTHNPFLLCPSRIKLEILHRMSCDCIWLFFINDFLYIIEFPIFFLRTE